MTTARAAACLSTLTVPVRVPGLRERLEEWASNDQADSLMRELDEVEKFYEESYGFRWRSPGCIEQEDRTLYEYRRWMTLYLVNKKVPGVMMSNDMAEDANDKLIFPDETALLLEYICKYLIMAARNVRSRTPGKPIRFQTISRRRMYMLYWITTGRKAKNPPSKPDFIARTDECIHLVAKTMGFNIDPTSKVYLGRPEIIQLIDYDTGLTPNIAVAEQHHTAWLFGLICGIRPGSIAQARKRPGQFLRWGDLVVTREIPAGQATSNGNFVVQITFRHLKGNRDNPEHIKKHLKMTITSPRQAKNIPLSLPHRLLVILLRRSLLQDHETLESLLTGNEYQIALKPHAADLPVLLATTAKGLKLTDKAAASTSLTEYLHIRAVWKGYHYDSSMYSWRRKAGTQVERMAGVARARQFMHHDPGSHVFETHYDQGLYDFDVVGVALDDADGSGNNILEMEASQALHRAQLVKTSIDRETIITAFVDKHPDVTEVLGDPQRYKMARKRVRRAATRAILEEEATLQRLDRGVPELQRRLEELRKPSKIYEMIAARISAAQDDNAVGPGLDDLAAAHDYRDLSESHGFDDTDIDNGMEVPATEGEVSENVTVRVEDEADIGEKVEATWRDMLRSFMELLLEMEPLAQQPNEPLCCPLCRLEPSIPQAKKDHNYQAESRLKRHLESVFHYPVEAFRRRIQATESRKGTVECPYGCRRIFTTMEGLEKHIKSPYQEKWGRHHEDRKRDDGWYDDGFYPPKRIGVRSKRHISDMKKEAAGTGYTFLSEFTSPKRAKVIRPPVAGLVRYGVMPGNQGLNARLAAVNDRPARTYGPMNSTYTQAIRDNPISDHVFTPVGAKPTNTFLLDEN